jgi:hypothetical protein
VKVINDKQLYQFMTVLYLPIATVRESDSSTIPSKIVQDLLMAGINEMELQNDRDSQGNIS